MCGAWEGALLAGKESEDSMSSVGGVRAFVWTQAHISVGRTERVRSAEG